MVTRTAKADIRIEPPVALVLRGCVVASAAHRRRIIVGDGVRRHS